MPPLTRCLQVPYGGQSFGKRGVRTEQYTMVIERKDNQALRYTLFDNLADPWQLQNIAADKTALVSHLVEKELVPWLEKTGAPWRGARRPPAPFASLLRNSASSFVFSSFGAACNNVISRCSKKNRPR
ncbi:hypothetical protein GM658_26800 [Pseudoduganella eburnea]|uniref:DUF4976 domain-containing protein n=1 Tax=Massilia eburnea TaxID=1776165 RepID=A0A6L6QPD6_9BURK|nr:hypothetical protein [Massilia eburnea]MTW14229.1 hypothetical protein [Massilia eburnea]